MLNAALEKVYQAYYTKSDVLVEYMIQMLCVEKGMKILEPCAGDGVFIDAILNRSSSVNIDAYELNSLAAKDLQEKYAQLNNISITCADTLIDERLRSLADAGGAYHRIIANPPYGAWQDYQQRTCLKKIYTDLYVKESYTLFLYAAIKLLKANGRLVFIIPDTWLNLHRHTKLRQYLLKNTKIIEIALIPSSFFPNVNFGYANLSIITLQKSLEIEECLKNSFSVFNNFKKPAELLSDKHSLSAFRFVQNDILNNIDSGLFIAEDNKIQHLINNAPLRVGDIADCVTGIYSGNDKRYLRVINDQIKNAKNYLKVLPADICKDYSVSKDLLNGLDQDDCFLPIIKGGNIRYLKPDHWFIDWHCNAVKAYKSDAKARFQNANFYFKTGIAVPMVSSSRITAALMEQKIFDQSIVGIFSYETDLTYYLLAFFNSDICNHLIRTINPSANNSANYIKKIPFIKPSTQLLIKVDDIVKDILNSLKHEGSYDLSLYQQLNLIFDELYKC